MTRKLLTGLFALLISISGKVLAQETTATLNGVVNDERGGIIAGATITVVHEPTGATIYTQSNKKGLFVLPNLKPGGPYTVKVSFVGFSDQKMVNQTYYLATTLTLIYH